MNFESNIMITLEDFFLIYFWNKLNTLRTFHPISKNSLINNKIIQSRTENVNEMSCRDDKIKWDI